MTRTPLSDSVENAGSCVYSFESLSGETVTKFHVAVFSDDLHCFVVLASIPVPIAIGPHFSGVLELALGEIFKTAIVDWNDQKVILGITSWLIHRDNREWRAIRRIQLTEDGRAEKLSWLPQEVAEPMLRALEDSVPAPQLFDFPDDL